MSLLLFDAMQECETFIKPHWDGVFNSSITGRDGTTHGASCPAPSLATGQRILTLPSTAATCIVGCAVTPGQITTNAFMLVFRDTSDVSQLFILMNSSGLIEARKGSTGGSLLGTSSGHTPLIASDFPSLQVKAVLHTSAGSVVVKLNDVTVLNLTGVSTSSSSTNVKSILFYSESGSNRANYDDLYVCDGVDATATQGQPNNDFLGDLKVAVLVPSGAGASTQWTPSTGSNYAAVDEIPVNTTDYVSDATTGDQDLYAMTDLPANAVSVYAIQTQYYAEKSDSGAATVKPAIKESGGTVTKDTAQGLGTTWGGISGVMKAVKPSNSALWSVSDVNGLQVGQEVG